MRRYAVSGSVSSGRYVEMEERKNRFTFTFQCQFSVYFFFHFHYMRYLIYVMKHLQYFNVQLMLNYRFLTHGQLLDFLHIWLLFRLSWHVVVKYLRSLFRSEVFAVEPQREVRRWFQLEILQLQTDFKPKWVHVLANFCSRCRKVIKSLKASFILG